MSRFALALLTLAACGGSSPPGTSGALDIAVDTASYPGTIGVIQPASGREFLQLSTTLVNSSGSVESIAFALFAVRTASGLQVQASPATTQVEHACAADQSLAPGGTTTCALAFEVPTSETATTLVWLDPTSMRSSTASLPVVMQPSLTQACQQAQMLKNAGTSACTSCVSANCKQSNGCTTGDYNCLIACEQMGGGGCGCVQHCIVSDACRQSILAGYQCESTTCGAQCN